MAVVIGTDSMLLGAWAHPSSAQTVLDVGTGTGVLSLMIAQRATATTIVHAIDVDEPACSQAAENFAASSWSSQLHAYHTSFDQVVETFIQQQQQSDLEQSTSGSMQHTAHETTSISEDASHLSQAVETTASNATDALLQQSIRANQLKTFSAKHKALHPPSHGYDMIISNPPYFVNSYLPPGSSSSDEDENPSYKTITQTSDATSASHGMQASQGVKDGGDSEASNSIKTSSSSGGQYSEPQRQQEAIQRALARHTGAGETALTYESLAAGSATLLSPQGQLCVVVPVESGEADLFTSLAKDAGLQLVEKVRVYTMADSDVEKRRLLKFIKAATCNTGNPCQDGMSGCSQGHIVLKSSSRKVSAIDSQALGTTDDTDLSATMQGRFGNASNWQGSEHTSNEQATVAQSHLASNDMKGVLKDGVLERVLVVNRSREEKLALGATPGQFVPTQDYLTLTQDFHHRAFVDKWWDR